jgi:class 3 adenylate cyclase/predicted ATPase
VSFIDTVRRARELLRAEGRITLRGLKREFNLDDEALEELVEELVDGQQVATREGKVVSWRGPAAESQSPATTNAPTAEHEPSTEAERRQLTVMFCDLVDSSGLAARLDAEDWREVVRAYQARCAEVVARFEGHIAQYLGDGLLVYFGHPHAHEDDPVRAVHAALGIAGEIPALNQRLAERLDALADHPLHVRLGVHTGPVVVGEVGNGREQLALGDTLNVAARLQEAADPDGVVISDATRRLVQGLFVLDAIGPVALKGIPQPQQLYRALQPSGVQSRFELAAAHGFTPLVGREHEVALLLERWEQAKEGAGRVVSIDAEAGMGKSRLVAALRERLSSEPHGWLECRCSAYYRTSALYPVIDLIRRALLIRDEEPADAKLAKLEQGVGGAGFGDVFPLFASLLSLPLPDSQGRPGLSPEAQRRKTLEALSRWLFALSERQPLVLVVEDLQWADASSVEFLGSLIDQVPTASILVLLTFRPTFEPVWAVRSHVLPLTLSPLTRRQTAAMVEDVAGGKRLPLTVLDQLYKKTDGVPLFVEELTKSVLESGLLADGANGYERTDPLPDLAIPVTLKDSLTARLDRLGPAKEVAQLAAVLGRDFSYELLAAISSVGDQALQEGLVRLVGAELLYQRGTPPASSYTFKHALVQDTAYQSLLRQTRQQHHAQVARALERRYPDRSGAEPEVIARHYDEAGLVEEAIAYYQEAGERATQRSAYVEAVQHLRRGVELVAGLPDGPERDQVELRLQVALGAPLMASEGHSSPALERAMERARALSRSAGATPELARALFGLAAFTQARAELETCYALGKQLLELSAGSDDTTLLIRSHLAFGCALCFLGDFCGAVEHFEAIRAVYDPGEHHRLAYVDGQDPGVVGRTYGAVALWSTGRPDQARAWAAEGVELARSLGHPLSLAFALVFAAFVHVIRREPGEAQRQASEAIALSSEQGFPLWLGAGAVARGWATAARGLATEGVEEVRSGLAQLGATGVKLAAPLFALLLADANRRIRAFEEASGALELAVSLAEETRQHFYDAELQRLGGEILLDQGTPDAGEAERRFRRAIEIARSQKAKSLELRAATSLTRLWRDQGKRTQARDLLAPIYGWFTEGFSTQDLKDARALLEELA